MNSTVNTFHHRASKQAVTQQLRNERLTNNYTTKEKVTLADTKYSRRTWK